MDASGRKARRPQRASERPFYVASGTTSSDIIAEARTAVRSLKTKRPCTPTESKRTLFGSSPAKPTEARPPSAFSLGQFQYDESTSRPPSGRARLTPLDHAPILPEESFIPGPPSTPPGRNRRSIRVSLQESQEQENASNAESELTAPQAPTIAAAGGSTSPSKQNKIKTTVPGGDGPIALCPSPPKRVNSSPGSVSSVRRNSTGPLPTRPSVIKSEILNARRVRSGPKERSSPVPVDHFIEKEGLNGKSSSTSSSISEPSSGESSPRTESPKKLADRASSGDKRKRKPHADSDKSSGKDELTIYYEERVKPLLAQMETKFTERNSSDLCRDCLTLWNVLEKKGMIGKSSGSASARRRGEILKTVFKFLDINDSRLMLRLGRLIISMKVTGNNINNIGMVVYRLAKTDKNDQMFMEEDMLRCLVQALQTTDVLTCRDALVYIIGAMKHLSNSNLAAQKELISLDTVKALAQILGTICKDIPQYSKPELQMSSLLVQVTGVLRNLADVNGARELYISHSIVKLLAGIMDPFSSDEDLMYNVSRILSKLTLYNECCYELMGTENCFKALLKVLRDHQKKQEIVVRVCFILGNLTSKNDEARSQLYNTKACLSTLLSVMVAYFSLDAKAANNESGKAPIEGIGDVLVKVVRVIANLSINYEVGHAIATSEQCISILLNILDVKNVESSEELVLNTVATLNNLSFYHNSSSPIVKRQLDITESLLSLLLPENMDAMVEASRVFGNLTRSREVRSLLRDNKVDEIMIALLDAGERETVFTACGVLINLLTDDISRPKLREEGGVKKLIDVLHDFGKNDWQLSAMVCQTLWNYSGDITTSALTFGEEETNELIDILSEYLDEELVFEDVGTIDPALYDTLHDVWLHTFCPVGENMLDRIKTHHTDLVPLDNPN